MANPTFHCDVRVTFYGFDDNDDGEGHYGNDTIAYPKLHKVATEDEGSFACPSTFACEPVFIRPGLKIYVPRLQKYYIMEDGCRDCSRDWHKGIKHIDLYIGKSQMGGHKLKVRQEELTMDGPEVIVVNPPKDLPVDTQPLFAIY